MKAKATIRMGRRAHADISNRALRILVVEDNEADRYLIKRALAGCVPAGRITYAFDGVQALDLIARGVRPDLALIDLSMPRMSGFGLLTEFSRQSRKFPVAVLTSSQVLPDVTRSVHRGADCVLTKPSTAEELRKMLSTVVVAVCAERQQCSI